MKETYKETISKKEMPNDVYEMIKVIEQVKKQAIEDNPTYKEDLKEIPNAGIYTYNKLNEFIKNLEEKSITEKSVMYAILKGQLLMLMDENICDILTYEDNDEEKEVELPQEIEEMTFWGMIKEYIRIKLFSAYITEEFEETMEEYMDKRNEARKTHRNRVIDRVEDIDKIKMDEEFVKISILNFLSVAKFKKDFNPEVFRKEVEEELGKLGMTGIMQGINKEIDNNDSTLKTRIKANIDTANIDTANIPTKNVKAKDDNSKIF